MLYGKEYYPRYRMFKLKSKLKYFRDKSSLIVYVDDGLAWE